MSSNESVYDGLLEYLEGMLFQIPVMSFIDRHSAVFDPATENCPEYERLWEHYKELVSQLLEGFREDCGVKDEQIIMAVKELDKNRDLHELYKSVFEHIFATVNIDIFIQMMTKKNIELQQQVLVVLLSQTGQIPGILTDDTTEKKPSGKSSEHDQEDEIIQDVIRKSKAEYEALQAKEKESEEDMIKVLQLSKLEAENLQHMHEELQNQLHVNLASLSMNETQSTNAQRSKESSTQNNEHSKPEPLLLKSKSNSKEKNSTGGSTDKKAVPPAMFAKPSSIPAVKSNQPVTDMSAKKPSASSISDLPTVPGVKQISGAEAAANWLATAMSETSQSPSAAQIAAGMPNISREQLLERQQFLKQQRDKLIALKHVEREKHLKTAEKKQPTRPQSARAARLAMASTSESKPEIDAKQLAMRKAIAEKLKKEVIVLDETK